MGVEIERKFLVDKKIWSTVQPTSSFTLVQGYLSFATEKTVRVRVKDDSGFITVKGKTESMTRKEFEYSIPKEEALEMLSLFCDRTIEKVRHEIPYEGIIWEVDEFTTPNPGLILAEAELISENQQLIFPPWITEEVTGQPEYYNSNMLQ
jgi:CYTH domain-containing protein